ncbi:GH92 family glycosyl hydrolase [Streptomyces enissocaesilis]|uniref:GH92 family glycosyl hydrolase n=1 Tax=Streptomyces enissocaesilis TaxID=332589 RepID=UPI0031CE2D0C
MTTRPSRRTVLAAAALGGATVLSFPSPAAFAAAPRSWPGTGLPVDTFLGTDGNGNVFPGAQVPFGFAQLGPDMTGAPTHGYKTGAPVLGFSQTKASGTGGGMWGNLRMLPYTGEVTTDPATAPVTGEETEPGYYACMLSASGIRAELTAERLTGHARYAYPTTGAAQLQLDVTSAIDFGTKESWQQRPQRVEVHVVGDDRIEGLVEFAGGWNSGRYAVYFSLRTDLPFTTTTTWVGKRLTHGGRDVVIGAGDRVGITMTFPEGRTVSVRTGMSLVSVARARRTADRSARHFPTARRRAASLWRDVLGTVAVDGGTDGQRLILGSALRNVHIGLKDITGEDAPGGSQGPHYTDYFALWDTFRTVHPLLTLIQPERQRDMVNSHIRTSKEFGWGFDGLLAHSPGLTQGGTNGDVMIADAFVKGLDGIDYRDGLELMLRNAEHESPHPMNYGRETVDYIEHGGWLPMDYTGSLPPDHGGHGRTVSRTLEYNYNDFCIAQVATGLGRRAEAERLRRRARGWRSLWDGETLSVRPRFSDGRWADPYSKWWNAPWDRQRTDSAWEFGWFETPYYEGSAMNYSTYVPHDTAALVAACGGDAAFTGWLDELFDRPHWDGGFDPGNEPAFLAPWLYLHAGRPDRTAERVRALLSDSYRPARDGWPGNDDSGAMSALYVFSSLGLFPNAGQDFYYLGSPVFPEAELQTGRGRRLRIVARGTSESHKYVRGIRLDGRPLDRAWLSHDELVRARVLEFDMSDRPGDWGTRRRPPARG